MSGSLFRLPSGIKPAIGGMVLGTLLRLVRTIFPRFIYLCVGVDFTIRRVLEIGRNTCRVTMLVVKCGKVTRL